MARHEIRARLNTQVVTSKDLEILVKRNRGKLGTLLISKGNLEWAPARKYGYKWRLSWRDFADVMQRAGRLVKVKR